MDFPDQGLVQLAPRDLTGPGIELFFVRTAISFATASGSVGIPADQTSREKLYMLKWAVSLIPDPLPTIAVGVRWYLQGVGTQDLQLWGQNTNVRTAIERREFDSPFLVIPGGRAMLLVGDFSAAGPANVLEGAVWGYSFPKGNVLSF